MKIRLKGNNIDGIVCDVAGHVGQKLIDKGMAEPYEVEAIVEPIKDEAPAFERAVLTPEGRFDKKKKRRKKNS